MSDCKTCKHYKAELIEDELNSIRGNCEVIETVCGKTNYITPPYLIDELMFSNKPCSHYEPEGE